MAFRQTVSRAGGGPPVGRPRADESPLPDLRQQARELLVDKRGLAGQQAIEHGAPGCKRRSKAPPDRAAPRPARDSCTAECRVPRPATSRSRPTAPPIGRRPGRPGPAPGPIEGLARPQSTTSTSPNGPSMTFAGFRSRWTTPWLSHIVDRVADVEEAGQELAELDRGARGGVRRPRLVESGDRLLEGFTSDQPHHIIGTSIVPPAQAVDGDDPRMLEAAGNLGFAEEPRLALEVAQRIRPGFPSAPPRAQVRVVGNENPSRPSAGKSLVTRIARERVGRRPRTRSRARAPSTGFRPTRPSSRRVGPAPPAGSAQSSNRSDPGPRR